MKRILLLLALVVTCLVPSAHAGDAWPEGSRALLAQMQTSREGAVPEGFGPSYVPTKDGRSFLLIWMPDPKNPPSRWLVSLPGTHGNALRDFAVWSPYVKGRGIGVITVQWWLGQGDATRDYYTPFDIYRELDVLMSRLGVQAGQSMLHGFSRGSANLYAVAALDRARGRKYFSTFVANSGGASLDYPPTRLVNTGEFGDAPYAGTSWVTVCGGRDENPERDGCTAMQRSARWIESKGGIVAMAIEDAEQGHGALHRNPENAQKLMDWFAGR